VIGAESIGHIGPEGVLGDLIFVLTGLMFAVFGTLLRHWRVSAFAAATVISVLSLSLLPLYAISGGPGRVAALGWAENALQALGQGILAGPAAMYLFAFSIQLLGVARAAVFPAMVPALTILVGWLLLGEPPTALQATGLVLVLCGFYLAQRQR
jgi:drug/metabolite transporter (DMT)-like permease